MVLRENVIGQRCRIINRRCAALRQWWQTNEEGETDPMVSVGLRITASVELRHTSASWDMSPEDMEAVRVPVGLAPQFTATNGSSFLGQLVLNGTGYGPPFGSVSTENQYRYVSGATSSASRNASRAFAVTLEKPVQAMLAWSRRMYQFLRTSE